MLLLAYLFKTSENFKSGRITTISCKNLCNAIWPFNNNYDSVILEQFHGINS